MKKINFFDINDFNSENFVFFTYSLTNKYSKDVFKMQISNTRLYSEIQDFYLFKFPFAMKNKTIISCSLTTSKDYYTYGRIGYIVSAPIENILYVGQAPFNESNDKLGNKTLLSPYDIRAGKGLFNEVILEDSTIYGITRPLAIFINLTDTSELEQYMILQKLNKVKEATSGIYPVLNLTNNKLEVKSLENQNK